MMRNPTRAAAAASLICFAISADVSAQGAKGFVGAWSLVTNVVTDASGKKTQTFGDKPMGQVIFTSNGRYDLVITRSDLPKFAADNRLKGTTDENKAVVGGSISHFGKYTVDEKTKTLHLHIESASYPNWNGTEQKRPYTLAGDDLKWTAPNASGGGSADLVWKRIK